MWRDKIQIQYIRNVGNRFQKPAKTNSVSVGPGLVSSKHRRGDQLGFFTLSWSESLVILEPVSLAIPDPVSLVFPEPVSLVFPEHVSLLFPNLSP